MTDDTQFQRRFDMARMVLERKYRWAKVTLRNLTPVARAEGTMAVDKHFNLYHGPIADTWTDKEFVGALWHEVNHLLRHHPDRLAHMPKKYGMDPKWMNVVADLEINDDLRDQGITLPDDVMYSERFNHECGLSAEDHFFQFIDEQEEQEQQAGDDQDDDEDEEQEEQDGSNPPPPGPGGAEKPKREAPDDAPSCGSGSGGPPDGDELPEPTPEEQAQKERAQRKQDEDVVEAAGEAPGDSLPPGMSQDVYEAAVERLGKSEHDWRATLAVELRNAMEQQADEAEEYTFRRRSRRQGALTDLILPGSFRPVPRLGVCVDVSGSMDQHKLTASMRELHGILERLAIPSFTAYAWNTQLKAQITVQTAADIETVMKYRGGGTDMWSSVEYAMANGDEVIVVLTDNETHWPDNGPHGVPVIIGGINRRKDFISNRYPVPNWARLVDVMQNGEDDD